MSILQTKDLKKYYGSGDTQVKALDGVEDVYKRQVIMSGIVYVNNQKVDKAGFFCSPEDQVEVRGASLQYVSRGGLKIEKALN